RLDNTSPNPKSQTSNKKLQTNPKNQIQNSKTNARLFLISNFRFVFYFFFPISYFRPLFPYKSWMMEICRDCWVLKSQTRIVTLIARRLSQPCWAVAVSYTPP